MIVASVLSAGALLGGGIGIGHALATAQAGTGTARLASHSVGSANHAPASFAVVRTTQSPNHSGAGNGPSGGHHCPNHSGN
jgi:hypothetical protein